MVLANELRFGIVQGRLIQSPGGQLQCFPKENWEAEFFLASSLGIDYIELLAEREFNPHNPLWTNEGVAKIKQLAQINSLSLYAFCNDYIIDNSLIEDLAVLEQNFQLIERGALLGCKKFILPLFEKSELTSRNLLSYVGALRAIADKALAFGITVCLETTLNGAELVKALDAINHIAIGLVYDTGNRIAFGHDLAADIRLLGSRINHVHLKDKNQKNENVILGTGLVNFQHVFEALAEIGYKGSFTFESQRGKNPIRTAAYNIQLAKFFHAESSLA